MTRRRPRIACETAQALECLKSWHIHGAIDLEEVLLQVVPEKRSRKEGIDKEDDQEDDQEDDGNSEEFLDEQDASSNSDFDSLLEE